MKREKLSALVDGELDEAEARAVNRDLADPETLATMELYNRIGEELRASGGAAELSQEFSARMSAALAAEPPLKSPDASQADASRPENSAQADSAKASEGAKRPAKGFVPGLAGMAAIAVVLSPQFLFVLQAGAGTEIVSATHVAMSMLG